MILCSVSIQVSPDLVVCYNRIRAGICAGFFHCCCVVSFLLLELASAFMTQIPSDKLKMIDSESKMETAPQGVSECPHLCPHTSARSQCMHVHECGTATSSVYPQFMQPCKCCRWSERVYSMHVGTAGRKGWAYYIGFLTLLKNVRRWQISDV